MTMQSSRPYLARALYEWILDNKCTPYVLVNALATGVEVPQQYVKNGQIVLNVSPSAVVGFNLDNQFMSFNGRFGGVPVAVKAPVSAIMGIYAKENGQGMFFDADDTPPPSGTDPTEPSSRSSDKKPSRPSLKVVK